jgi:hypothetical protein
LIAAPRQIPLDVRTTLPVVAVQAGSHAQLRRAGFARNAILVAVDLDRNRVYANRVIDLPPEPAAGPLPPPPDGYAVTSEVVDARECVGLEWLPARLTLRILMRDRVSNCIDVLLGKSPDSYDDPELAAEIARLRALRRPTSVQPPEGELLPRYPFPPLPTGPGLAFTVPRVIPLGPGARCVLRGSARVEPLAHEQLDPSAVPTGLVERVGEPPRPKPDAIIGVTVLVIAADTGVVISQQLRVPAWAGESDGEVVGHFEVDLFTIFPDIRRQRAQTWFAYALHGRHMAGAGPFALLPLELI